MTKNSRLGKLYRTGSGILSMLVIERGHGILHRHTRKISPVNSKQFSGELAAEIPCTDGTGQLTVHARNYKGILKE